MQTNPRLGDHTPDLADQMQGDRHRPGKADGHRLTKEGSLVYDGRVLPVWRSHRYIHFRSSAEEPTTGATLLVGAGRAVAVARLHADAGTRKWLAIRIFHDDGHNLLRFKSTLQRQLDVRLRTPDHIYGFLAKHFIHHGCARPEGTFNLVGSRQHTADAEVARRIRLRRALANSIPPA